MKKKLKDVSTNCRNVSVASPFQLQLDAVDQGQHTAQGPKSKKVCPQIV